MRFGTLVVVTGPMFAGKTTWIINHLQAKEPVLGGVSCKNPAIYAHILDMGRYTQQAKLVSHDGAEYMANWLTDKEAESWLDNPPLQGHDWLILDEAQFLAKGTLLPLCKKVLSMGINVCV